MVRWSAPKAYVRAVSVFGGGATVFAVSQGILPTISLFTAALLVIAAVVAELIPIRLRRHGFEEEINSATTFEFAFLLIGGMPFAVLAMVISSVIADLRQRKPFAPIVFNAGQYSLSMVAAGLIYSALGAPHDGLGTLVWRDTPAIIGAGIAFFLVNTTLVGAVSALHQGSSVRAHIVRDLPMQAPTALLTLAMSPLVTVIAFYAPSLIPLLLLPLLAVHQAGRAAVRDRERAEHDDLTGLANRTAVHARITAALDRRSGDERVAVMFMDLDRFKEINDTLGHRHGDELLKAVSERLADVALHGETVARLGGDEFAIVVPGLVDETSVEAAAERVLSALHEPILLDGLRLEIDASLGIAVAPQHGEDIDTLLQRADIAMYQAKDGGLTSGAIYSPTEDEHSFDRLALLGELRRAIDHGQLELVWMPIVRLGDDVVQSVEALVRWEHPLRGTIPPAVFVPHAERTGLIRQLTLEVVDQALAQCAAWQAAGTPVRIAVNLSTRNLLDRGLPEDIRHRLEVYGVPATLLEFEITESTIMADPVRAQLVLQELHAMGVRLSIDDFGTGYSSLGYLKELPVSTLKIDRSFVTRMLSHQPDRVIVKSTIDLARNLGLHVVAEGVEDIETHARLAALGCHGGQGFLFGLPAPATALDLSTGVATTG